VLHRPIETAPFIRRNPTQALRVHVVDNYLEGRVGLAVGELLPGAL
jgi:hypothetical protein